jgi:hypothetical protein
LETMTLPFNRALLDEAYLRGFAKGRSKRAPVEVPNNNDLVLPDWSDVLLGGEASVVVDEAEAKRLTQNAYIRGYRAGRNGDPSWCAGRRASTTKWKKKHPEQVKASMKQGYRRRKERERAASASASAAVAEAPVAVAEAPVAGVLLHREEPSREDPVVESLLALRRSSDVVVRELDVIAAAAAPAMADDEEEWFDAVPLVEADIENGTAAAPAGAPRDAAATTDDKDHPQWLFRAWGWVRTWIAPGARESK